MPNATISRTERAIVLRTDFSNDETWEEVKRLTSAPDTSLADVVDIEFLSANLDYISDIQFDGWTLDDIPQDCGGG